MNEGTAKLLLEAERLMKAVERALKSANLDIDELTVAADPKGTVSIFGLARTVEAATRAGEIANSIPGVKRVLNTVMVK
jgi:osmotically-inducible protein OsmY